LPAERSGHGERGESDESEELHDDCDGFSRNKSDMGDEFMSDERIGL
jgi:hypothetical protein